MKMPQTINLACLSVYQYGNHGTSAIQQGSKENEASGRTGKFQSNTATNTTTRIGPMEHFM